ncbi:cracked [Carabus blaptoides fortunei]
MYANKRLRISDDEDDKLLFINTFTPPGDNSCPNTYRPQYIMIRHLVLLVIILATALVLCKPTPQNSNTPHHRTKRWDDFPNLTFTFDCTDRAVGFYADTEHHCQIFHMCDEDGRRIPYVCANETSFNQEFRICDWEYNFDCGDAEKWYYLNELTYVTDPPKTLKNIEE